MPCLIIKILPACIGTQQAEGHVAGAPYLKLLSGFQEKFPDVRPTPLIATVCFYTPVIRDFCSWCGVRQVLQPPPAEPV